MSKKISEYFQVTPKGLKINNKSSKVANLPKIRDCFVALKDINGQFGDEFKLFDDISIVNFLGCSICNLKFQNENALESHIRNKHTVGQLEQFECDFDGKIFFTKNNLNQHMLNHLSRIKCEICNKMLKIRTLKNHIKNLHSNDTKFECKICSKTFKCKKNLASHLKIHNKEFQCEICNKLYPSNFELSRHKRLYHENTKSFECETCGKRFNLKAHLEGHQRIHDPNRLKPYKCQRCDFATDNKHHFKGHQKFHERQDQKYATMKNPLKCEKCPTFHQNQKYLKLHMKSVHPKVKFQCDLCGKLIKIKSSLIKHMQVHQIHTKLVEFVKLKSSLNCYICNKKFSKYLTLNSHINNKHPDGQHERFECDFDGKIFKTKALLYSHMKVHLPSIKCKKCNKILKINCMYAHLKEFHANDKKFQCNICKKKFKSLNVLTRHLGFHNKKFKCEICSKMYASSGLLNRHKKNIHANSNSFECEICGKKFNFKFSLKDHQKTHDKNRPKPYKCQQCDYATDKTYSFNKHQKAHDKQNKKFAVMKNPLKCAECSNFYQNKKLLRNHIKAVHPKNLYQCDLCAKFVKTRQHLLKHIQFHISKF